MGGIFSSGGGNPSSNLPGPNAGTTGTGGSSNSVSGPTINEKSYPGMNVYSISGNSGYNGPKLYFSEKAPNLRQYNLKENVYVIKSPNSNNSGNSNSGSGILSDLSNLSDFDYILIIGGIILVILIV